MFHLSLCFIIIFRLLITELSPSIGLCVDHDKNFLLLSLKQEKLDSTKDQLNKIFDDQEKIDILFNEIKLHPANQKLYAQFIDAVLWHSKEKKSIETLNFLIKNDPGNPKYHLDLALMNYNLKKYEPSLAILDNLQHSFKPYLLCQTHLLRAKNLFQMKQDEEGLNHYWTAVHSVASQDDADAFYNDLYYIMNESEYEELQSLPIQKIGDFYIRFWRARDPNLATEKNERIPEHYRRVAYARKNYRRYVRCDSWYNFYAESEHPLKEYQRMTIVGGLLTRFISSAVPEKLDLDDMGIIYVRHGDPDTQAFHVDPSANVPMNLSWKYYPTYNRAEMIFHFSKIGGIRGWMLQTVPVTFVNRWTLGGPYALIEHMLERLKEKPPDRLHIPDEQFTIRNLTEQITRENIEHVKVGLQTETSDFKYEEQSFDFPFQFLTFKGEKNNSLVELYYGVEGKEIALDTSRQAYSLNLSSFIGFYDGKWNEVKKLDEHNNIPVAITPEEWKKSSAIQLKRFDLSPGTYQYEFHLKELASDKLAVYKGSCTIADYQQPNLMISDILLAGPLRPTDQPTIFKKGDIGYDPHMFKAYVAGDAVGLYFELYNLTRDKSGDTHFQITCRLQPVGADEEVSRSKVTGFFRKLLGLERGIVSSMYDYNGDKEDEQIYINFDVGKRGTGQYEMVVHVQDLNSDQEVQKRVVISLK